MRLILASGSLRRADLLRSAGIEFDVVVAEVDESVRAGETPRDHVRRLAEDKARTALRQVGERPVLAADTIVVVDGIVLGKPAGPADAMRMLRMLSGRAHEVVTGVCLAGVAGPAGAGAVGHPATDVHTEVAVTVVEFTTVSQAEIDWYVASGEPADKAGAYAIQGLASRFVTRIDGSYSNVVGLPVALVYGLCKKVGLLVS